MLQRLRWQIAIPFVLLILGMIVGYGLLSGRFPLTTGSYLLIGIFGALAATGLAYLVSERITHSVKELTSLTRDLRKDQADHWAAFESFTELEELALAIKVAHDQLNMQVEDLESERSQLAAILFEMSDGVIIVDGKGNVQLINPAVRSFFEINEERLLGKSLIETFRHHQLVEIWQRCFETGQSQVVVLDFVARKLYLQCVATPLGNTQPQNILLLLTDLTRLRHLETIRQDFIHNISHELRTPLASLKALTETLLEGAMEDPPAARKFLQSMETEVDALSLMVSELLELSRIESGRVPLKLQPSSPCELLTKVVERLSLQSERAGLTLATHCDPEITPILADPSRMEQVLVNLLHNAIKFTPEGGRIDLFASQEGEAVLFSIQDTGAGIPAGDLNRIFERFYKTDRARRSGGTGLGLAISRHLVEAHGGKIWAESVEGQGSTFFFTVPTTQ